MERTNKRISNIQKLGTIKEGASQDSSLTSDSDLELVSENSSDSLFDLSDVISPKLDQKAKSKFVTK